ncbi:MAG: hypothetical protein VX278_02795 [Myxococcota bacterium]|nr:hypothetical protein [Myxococcota bacterium]
MEYRYELLIHEMDLFVSRQSDDSFRFSWQYIKSIIHSHALFLHQETGEPLDVVQARVWSEWESVFDLEEEDVLEPRSFVLKGLADLYIYSAPSFAECFFWLEVAFARARGLSTDDAVYAHYRYLDRHGGYEKYYGEPEPRWLRKNRRQTPQLKLLRGGLASL